MMNGADTVETLRCYGPNDLGRRLRVTWHGAEYRGRGRNTYWDGEIAVSGVRIEAMEPINRWNFDRRLEMVDERRILFEAVTSGNFGGVDMTLDDFDGATLSIETNRASDEIKLNDIGIDDHLIGAGGLERAIRVRRLPDRLRDCAFNANVAIKIAAGRDNPIWIRVATLDGHLAWSSPVYLWRE